MLLVNNLEDARNLKKTFISPNRWWHRHRRLVFYCIFISGWKLPLRKELSTVWTLFTFKIFFKINFYWSVVALQYCVSLYCTAKMVRPYLYMYPSLLDSLPLTAPQCVKQRPQHLLFSRCSLVIYFMHSINSVCANSSLPIPPSLTPSKAGDLYPYIYPLCLCLYFCFADKIVYTVFLDFTYMC